MSNNSNSRMGALGIVAIAIFLLHFGLQRFIGDPDHGAGFHSMMIAAVAITIPLIGYAIYLQRHK